MVATLLIVFRESLEAALIVSIVLAASRGIAGRTKTVVFGIAAGVVGACVVALLADVISDLAEGAGSELFNAGVLLAAVCMLAWHQIWMSTHAADLARETRQVGEDVRAGARPLSALAIVTAIAVLREGSETVLFLYGIAADGSATPAGMLAGGIVGLLIAAAIGGTFYFGLMRISMRHVFKVTGAIVTLLAAGLAAQAASFLAQAGILPPLGGALWDTSWLLTETNPLGQVLHVLIGYVARPQGIQIVAYLLTLAAITAASWAVAHKPRHPVASQHA